ncbi:hypothetical protein ACFV2U_47460 [Streptomyces sp. NPDC059697]
MDVEVLDFDLAASVAECAGKDFGEDSVPASRALGDHGQRRGRRPGE